MALKTPYEMMEEIQAEMSRILMSGQSGTWGDKSLEKVRYNELQKSFLFWQGEHEKKTGVKDLKRNRGIIHRD